MLWTDFSTGIPLLMTRGVAFGLMRSGISRATRMLVRRRWMRFSQGFPRRSRSCATSPIWMTDRPQLGCWPISQAKVQACRVDCPTAYPALPATPRTPYTFLRKSGRSDRSEIACQGPKTRTRGLGERKGSMRYLPSQAVTRHHSALFSVAWFLAVLPSFGPVESCLSHSKSTSWLPFIRNNKICKIEIRHEAEGGRRNVLCG